jgi:uncharacterized protein YecT (DUF1311 family)
LPPVHKILFFSRNPNSTTNQNKEKIIMKKILAMLMAVAMVSVAAAATTTSKTTTKTTSGILFNRPQFQTHRATEAGYSLTVPMIYKGVMSFDGWYMLDDAKECAVDSFRAKYDLYMTICQPCLDCNPCVALPLEVSAANTPAAFTLFGADAVASPITRWDLYLIKAYRNDVTAYKINLMQNHEGTFFTGSNNKNAWISFGDAQADLFISQTLVGPKSNYVFAYMNGDFKDGVKDKNGNVIPGVIGVPTTSTKATAYIKSITSMQGDFNAIWNKADAKLNKQVEDALKTEQNGAPVIYTEE